MSMPAMTGMDILSVGSRKISLFEEPVFCLTSDLDWASDFCIQDLMSAFLDFDIKPTLFATHLSPYLQELGQNDLADIGIHPNFLSGSSHGDDYRSVIDHMFELYPQAACFRSHCFFDNTHISAALFARGIKYDSNLCLFLQSQLTPMRHASGVTRLPVFWEDDCHWTNTGGDWLFKHYEHRFFSPGLKVINIHPFFLRQILLLMNNIRG